MRIATFGDVLLDVIVRLEQPLARGDDVRAATTTGAGGQAANVAAWAAFLGADARCISKRGNDAAGELVAHELGERGVELVGPVDHGARSEERREGKRVERGGRRSGEEKSE